MGDSSINCLLTNTGISEYEECVVIVFKKGAYCDAGTIRNNLLKGCDSSIDKVFIGKYDGCGGVENVDIFEGHDIYNAPKALFFHKWAIEFLTKDSIDDLIKDKTKLSSKIFQLMYLLRKDIFAYNCVGDQFVEDGEIIAMIQLNNRTNQYLLKKLTGEEL